MPGNYSKVQPGAAAGPIDFLEANDLEGLRDQPLVAEKTPVFRDYLACQAAIATVSSLGFTLLFSPATLLCGAMYDGAYLQLTQDQLEFSQPTPDSCALAKTKRSVRYENVMDTTIEDDCCLQVFGLKKLVVQTAGTGGTGDANMNGVQAVFLKDPEFWKEAINHAVKLSKSMSAPGAQGMGRDAVPKCAKAQKLKLDRIAELLRLNVITVTQAEEMRTLLLLKEEDYVLHLLGMQQLVTQGHLTESHLASAVALVMEKLKE